MTEQFCLNSSTPASYHVSCSLLQTEPILHGTFLISSIICFTSLSRTWHLWHIGYLGPWIPQCHPEHSMGTKNWGSNMSQYERRGREKYLSPFFTNMFGCYFFQPIIPLHSMEMYQSMPGYNWQDVISNIPNMHATIHHFLFNFLGLFDDKQQFDRWKKMIYFKVN